MTPQSSAPLAGGFEGYTAGYVIRSSDGSYLVERSASRGSAAGVGRIWSEESHRALRFASLKEAADALHAEFQDYERRNLVVESAAAPQLLAELREARAALERLQREAACINARQHAGLAVRPEDWSDLHEASNAARAFLSREGGAA